MIQFNLKPYIAEKAKVGLLFLMKVVDKVCSLWLYKTLYKFPLGKYIDVVVDHDMRGMRFLPIPCPQFVYHKRFGELQEEYAKLSGSAQKEGRVSRKEEITFIQYQIFFYSHALKLIVDFDNMQGAIDFLNKNGFEGTREELINAVSGELMGLKSNLDDLEAMEKAENPQTEKKKISRADYSKTIAVANKNGYPITYKTSVGDFINALNLQREEVARLKSNK
jgi:hypothetical protein